MLSRYQLQRRLARIFKTGSSTVYHGTRRTLGCIYRNVRCSLFMILVTRLLQAFLEPSWDQNVRLFVLFLLGGLLWDNKISTIDQTGKMTLSKFCGHEKRSRVRGSQLRFHIGAQYNKKEIKTAVTNQRVLWIAPVVISHLIFCCTRNFWGTLALGHM